VPQFVEVRFKGNRKAYFEWHESEPLRHQEAVIAEAERVWTMARQRRRRRRADHDRCCGCASARK
jgi:hypothetical protein